jgi:hypothetical protein
LTTAIIGADDATDKADAKRVRAVPQAPPRLREIGFVR